MANQNSTKTGTTWTTGQAYTLAVVCLAFGLAVGYFLRGSAGDQSAPAPDQANASVAPGMGGGMPQVSPEQLRAMAVKQAEPVLNQLKSKPNDGELLAKAANIFYDAQQYKDAIDYYQKALKIHPENSDVRTDMATCYWYLGDADSAISEFEKSLKYKPNSPSALFNMGVVKWQGKLDPQGALQAWEKLLATNPDYKDKAKVQDLIARAKQHTQIGAAGKTPKG